MKTPSRLQLTYDDLRAGRITRREFLERVTALGVASPLAYFLLQTGGVAAQEASPEASPAASPAASPSPTVGLIPDSGTAGQQRGAGGELRILQWQAPSILSVHNSGSFKEMLAACLVTEPLLHYLPDGTAVPCLVKEVPTVENGLLDAGFQSVTYNLLEGVVWSDGEPFTANDVAFTWQWIMNPDNASTNSAVYSAISNVEAVDDLTVRITFASPQIGWNTYFSSAKNGAIYPEHILSAGADASAAFQLSPIGTGPYVVDSFAPNDQVIYSINENYREPNKPYFSSVNLRGGGDPNSAATAVLQTGEWDFAWNLQVAPDILAELQVDGAGDLVVVPGTAVEWLALNFSDPNTEVDGQRSQWQTPHPFFSDPAVRQAMSLAVDRQAISDNLYLGAPGEPPGRNVLTGIPAYESPNTTWDFNLDQANQILEEAGWVLNGEVREKDGVQLSVAYATSIDPIRQQTQAVIQSALEQLGFEVRLLEIEAAVFFGTDEANDQSLYHMYWDMHEYAFSPAGPWPLSYMLRWVSHDGENIPQAENGWSRVNEGHYNNPEYDALYDQAAATADPAEAAELFIAMNDIIINDVVLVPIVQRASEKYGLSKRLNKENIAGGPFEALYWNIANWNEVA